MSINSEDFYDTCCKCGNKIDTFHGYELNYYDEDNDQYYCEDCYLELLAQNNN